LAGADVCEPEFHLPEFVQRFNAEAGAPFELRIAVPTEFESLVEKRADRPVVSGDLNPIFQGTYSSRIELKQQTREVERVLTSAEKMGAVLQWLGHPADETTVANAWEPALFNQAHDLMSGVMTDRVYDDTLRGYDYSLRMGRDELTSRLRRASESIDTQGEGTPLVVWNLLGWPRTDLVTARVGITDPEVMDVHLVGPDGQAVPVQLLSEVRASTGALLQADIAFVARDVPSLGYTVYRVLSSTRAVNALPTQSTDPVLENAHYRVTLDAGSGALTSLIAKGSSWEVLSGPANVIAREEDRGDLWELYHNLEAGFVTNKTPHMPPQAGQAVFSNEASDARGTVTCGNVISQFSIARTLGGGEFTTTVRLVSDLRRIDVHTRIVNQEKSVRYRALFPTAVSEGESHHEIPFGVVSRPAGIELPAQNWVDWGNADQGVALLNRGLPGNNVADGTLMLSLARSTRIQAYGYGGGYEPGMSSDSGYELGKELHFDYALVPHTGSWQKAGVYRDAWEFNQPMLALTATCHAGPLPSRWGFLEVAPQNVLVSALKNGPDGTAVLRVYETTGQATAATIRCVAPLRAVEEVNLLEDPGQSLAVQGRELQLSLGPFEIKTVVLHLEDSVR
jgi:alpha-mannosidase